MAILGGVFALGGPTSWSRSRQRQSQDPAPAARDDRGLVDRVMLGAFRGRTMAMAGLVVGGSASSRPSVTMDHRPRSAPIMSLSLRTRNLPSSTKRRLIPRAAQRPPRSRGWPGRAPESGVPRAMSARSNVGAERNLAGVGTPRICAEALHVGDSGPAPGGSKASRGAAARGSSTSGRLVAATMMMPRCLEPVHLDQKLVRSAGARRCRRRSAHATRPAARRRSVDEADAGAGSSWPARPCRARGMRRHTKHLHEVGAEM